MAVPDLVLPSGEGTEIVAVLRGANPEAKSLVLSASIESRLRERVAGAGADDALDKALALTGIAGAVARLAGVDGRRGC